MTRANRHVLHRFALKASLLAAFALLRWEEDLWDVATRLFLSAAVLTAFLAVIHRNRPFEQSLTYWDETIAFLFLSGLAAAIWIGSSK